MLKVKSSIPRIIHYVDYKEIEKLGVDTDRIYDDACQSDSLEDYCDGDFKYKVDLSEDTDVARVLREHLPQNVIDENKFGIYFYQ